MAKSKTKSKKKHTTSSGKLPAKFYANTYQHLTQEKLSQEDLDRLSQPPHHSLTRLKNGEGSSTDWYNVHWRLRSGLYTAEAAYIHKNVEEFAQGLRMIIAIMDRLKAQDEDTWLITPEEHEHLFACLEAVDQMCIEIHRHVMVHAYQRTQQHMVKFVADYDKFRDQLEKQAKESKNEQRSHL